MDENGYLEQRLDDQINWYSTNSKASQNIHKRLQIIQILSATSIPFLVGVLTEQIIQNYVVGSLGVLIAVITGITAVYKFEDKWIKYRTTAESLKHQKFLYQTKVAPYDGENSFSILVHRIEALISQENSEWAKDFNKLKDQH